jgi:hypothetical protein
MTRTVLRYASILLVFTSSIAPAQDAKPPAIASSVKFDADAAGGPPTGFELLIGDWYVV